MWNAKYKKPHGNTVRLALQAQGLPLSNNTLFRLHFQSEHLKAFFAPKFRVVVSVLPVWVRLWVKCENGGKLNLPPHYCFRTLTHIFQQLMRSTQNEKTELITQKSRLKRRLFKAFWSECGESNPGPPAPKGVRTWCYMCMNYIWPFPLRESYSPALFSPLSPRPPEAVVVSYVVVWKCSHGLRQIRRPPGAFGL